MKKLYLLTALLYMTAGNIFAMDDCAEVDTYRSTQPKSRARSLRPTFNNDTNKKKREHDDCESCIAESPINPIDAIIKKIIPLIENNNLPAAFKHFQDLIEHTKKITDEEQKNIYHHQLFLLSNSTIIRTQYLYDDYVCNKCVITQEDLNNLTNLINLIIGARSLNACVIALTHYKPLDLVILKTDF